MSAEDRSNLVQRASLNLLSDSNLTAVRGAFRHPRAVVFGWQYYYSGGSARGTVAFTSTEGYFGHIERAKPGDHFTVFEQCGHWQRSSGSPFMKGVVRCPRGAT